MRIVAVEAGTREASVLDNFASAKETALSRSRWQRRLWTADGP